MNLRSWLVDVLTFARASIGQLSHLERAMRFKGRVLGRFRLELLDSLHRVGSEVKLASIAG